MEEQVYAQPVPRIRTSKKEILTHWLMPEVLTILQASANAQKQEVKMHLPRTQTSAMSLQTSHEPLDAATDDQLIWYIHSKHATPRESQEDILSSKPCRNRHDSAYRNRNSCNSSGTFVAKLYVSFFRRHAAHKFFMWGSGYSAWHTKASRVITSYESQPHYHMLPISPKWMIEARLRWLNDMSWKRERERGRDELS